MKTIKIVCDFIYGFLDVDYNYPFHSIVSAAIFNDLLNSNLEIFKIKLITKFFSRNQSLCSSLWIANGTNTFFHEYLNQHPSFKNYREIFEIVEANFNPENRKKIFLGKFQTVIILFKIWIGEYDCSMSKYLDLDCNRFKALNTEEDYSNFIKLQNFSSNYFEYFYIEFENVMLNYEDSDNIDCRIFWKVIEQNLNSNFVKIRLKDLFIKSQNHQNNELFIKNMVNRIEFFFSDDEILDLIFYRYKNNRTFISFAPKFNPKVYEILWKFIAMHLNESHQKMFLEGVNPINFIDDLYFFEEYDTHDLHKKNLFNLYSKTELQNIILSCDNICDIFYGKSTLIYHSPTTSCHEMTKFITETFEQNSLGLNSLFMNNCSARGVNLLQLLNDEIYFCRFHLIHLAEKVFFKYELKEFFKSEDLRNVFEQ